MVAAVKEEEISKHVSYEWLCSSNHLRGLLAFCRTFWGHNSRQGGMTSSLAKAVTDTRRVREGRRREEVIFDCVCQTGWVILTNLTATNPSFFSSPNTLWINNWLSIFQHSSAGVRRFALWTLHSLMRQHDFLPSLLVPSSNSLQETINRDFF